MSLRDCSEPCLWVLEKWEPLEAGACTGAPSSRGWGHSCGFSPRESCVGLMEDCLFHSPTPAIQLTVNSLSSLFVW